jgi:hypothetical protein
VASHVAWIAPRESETIAVVEMPVKR